MGAEINAENDTLRFVMEILGDVDVLCIDTTTHWYRLTIVRRVTTDHEPLSQFASFFDLYISALRSVFFTNPFLSF